MIHLFHGQSIDASRKELQLLRDKFSNGEVVFYDGKTVTPTDFIQATQSTTLFGSDRLVVIENLFSRKITKKSQDFDTWITLIKQVPKDANIVFWEEKEQSKTVVSVFPKDTDIALFRPDRLIFTFVESLRPSNTEIILDNFAGAVKKDTPELIFAMLVRQFRYLILVKEFPLSQVCIFYFFENIYLK